MQLREWLADALPQYARRDAFWAATTNIVLYVAFAGLVALLFWALVSRMLLDWQVSEFLASQKEEDYDVLMQSTRTIDLHKSLSRSFSPERIVWRQEAMKEQQDSDWSSDEDDEYSSDTGSSDSGLLAASNESSILTTDDEEGSRDCSVDFRWAKLVLRVLARPTKGLRDSSLASSQNDQTGSHRSVGRKKYKADQHQSETKTSEVAATSATSKLKRSRANSSFCSDIITNFFLNREVEDEEEPLLPPAAASAAEPKNAELQAGHTCDYGSGGDVPARTPEPAVEAKLLTSERRETAALSGSVGGNGVRTVRSGRGRVRRQTPVDAFEGSGRRRSTPASSTKSMCLKRPRWWKAEGPRSSDKMERNDDCVVAVFYDDAYFGGDERLYASRSRESLVRTRSKGALVQGEKLYDAVESNRRMAGVTRVTELLHAPRPPATTLYSHSRAASREPQKRSGPSCYTISTPGGQGQCCFHNFNVAVPGSGSGSPASCGSSSVSNSISLVQMKKGSNYNYGTTRSCSFSTSVGHELPDTAQEEYSERTSAAGNSASSCVEDNDTMKLVAAFEEEDDFEMDLRSSLDTLNTGGSSLVVRPQYASSSSSVFPPREDPLGRSGTGTTSSSEGVASSDKRSTSSREQDQPCQLTKKSLPIFLPSKAPTAVDDDSASEGEVEILRWKNSIGRLKQRLEELEEEYKASSPFPSRNTTFNNSDSVNGQGGVLRKLARNKSRANLSGSNSIPTARTSATTTATGLDEFNSPAWLMTRSNSLLIVSPIMDGSSGAGHAHDSEANYGSRRTGDLGVDHISSQPFLTIS